MDDETEQSSKRPKYRDKLTERFAKGERVKQFQGFKEQAERLSGPAGSRPHRGRLEAITQQSV